MNVWPKPITRIHQIEPTSECNLRCKYCPHPKMQRPKQHMEMKTYERTMEWVEFFVKYGDQTECSLTGLGEPLLHPDLVTMVRLLREAMPNGKILFSTNGILLGKDPEFGESTCKALAKYDIELFISTHRPELATPAAHIAINAGLKVFFNSAFINSALDWAGQVDWKVSHAPMPCRYLEEGWGVVLENGSITTCCMDAEFDGVVASVWDGIGQAAVKPYKLCGSCSLDVPGELKDEVA